MGLLKFTGRMISVVLPSGRQRANGVAAAPTADHSALGQAEQERDRLAERLKALTEESRLDLSRSGLFIIGHARSGTTILQNALNDNDQIFLLGEPNLHIDPGTPDFGRRYNAMHRSFKNQENKSSYCPPLFPDDAPWDEYFLALKKQYQYVGAKIVINPHRAEQIAQAIFDFSVRHFYRSHYVFSFRDPVQVLFSTQGLATYVGQPPQGVAKVMRSFLEVIRLYVLMLRNLPNVRAVFHDQVSPATFEDLGRTLGLDLRKSYRYYDRRKITARTSDSLTPDERAILDEVGALFDEFRRQSLEGFDLIQIDQNLNALDPTHPTPLGRLSRRVDETIARLADGQR